MTPTTPPTPTSTRWPTAARRRGRRAAGGPGAASTRRRRNASSNTGNANGSRWVCSCLCCCRSWPASSSGCPAGWPPASSGCYWSATSPTCGARSRRSSRSGHSDSPVPSGRRAPRRSVVDAPPRFRSSPPPRPLRDFDDQVAQRFSRSTTKILCSITSRRSSVDGWTARTCSTAASADSSRALRQQIRSAVGVARRHPLLTRWGPTW